MQARRQCPAFPGADALPAIRAGRLRRLLGRQGSRGRALETLRRSGYARLTNPPLPLPRKSDDVGVSVSLGFSHPVEGECNKIISEGLIVSQFSQTSAFARVGGVVIGGHDERSLARGDLPDNPQDDTKFRRAMKLDYR
jgi:hypothetical protein